MNPAAPMSPNPGSARWQRQARFSAAPRAGRRLALVVDNDRDMRETLAILLKWAGHEVRTAANGAEAMAIAQEFHPEIVFLDVALPRLNGYEVCQQLRRLHAFKHASIFALSGISGSEHDSRCAEAGFTAQLTKPLDPAALMRLG
jgi:CheY-like chemotaxis protein